MVVDPHAPLPAPPRRRRRRRPTLWDVREPQYGIPLPPPGTPVAAAPSPPRGGPLGGPLGPPRHHNHHYHHQNHNPYNNNHHNAQNSAYAAAGNHLSLAARAPQLQQQQLHLQTRHVVRPPRPGEAGALAGIDIKALRALLTTSLPSSAAGHDGRSSSAFGPDANPGGVGDNGNGPGMAASGNGGANGTGNMGGSGSGVGGGGVGADGDGVGIDVDVGGVGPSPGGAGTAGSGMDAGNGAIPDAAAAGGAVGLGGMQATRHARRLYVGNLPPETTDLQIGDFFNRALVAAHGSESGDEPVISVYINLDKRFAFIETRTMREAAAGLMLDGVRFRDMFLRVRRPNDFQPSAIAGGAGTLRPPDAFDPTVLGIVSTQVSDGPNKMFVGGLPYTLTEKQIKSLLATYGQLAAFNLIKEPNSGMSKGFAFFEYVDGAVVDAACKGLHGMKVGDKTLTVRRATHSSANTVGTFASGTARPNGTAATVTGTAASTDAALPTPSGPIPASALIRTITRVVCLDDAVSPDELESDTEHAEIVEDVRDEARKLGAVEEVLVPRRADGEKLAAAVGRIFVRYAKTDDADRAQMVFAGRCFGERTIASSFFDEERFKSRKF